MNDMMKRASALALAAGLLIGASACSSDGEKANNASVQNETSDGPVTPTEGQSGEMGLDDAVDELGLDNLASAMVTAMGADRYEIEGDQLHLYLSQDGMISDSMSACIVAGSLLDEGDAVVVIHDDAGETTC